MKKIMWVFFMAGLVASVQAQGDLQITVSDINFNNPSDANWLNDGSIIIFSGDYAQAFGLPSSQINLNSATIVQNNYAFQQYQFELDSLDGDGAVVSSQNLTPQISSDGHTLTFSGLPENFSPVATTDFAAFNNLNVPAGDNEINFSDVLDANGNLQDSLQSYSVYSVPEPGTNSFFLSIGLLLTLRRCWLAC